jgi:hypothetical protein
MRLWKVLVLLAGVAGVIGFFTPLVEYRSTDGKITGDASAFQMARGVDNASEVFAQGEQLGLSREDARRIAKVFHEGLNAYRGPRSRSTCPRACSRCSESCSCCAIAWGDSPG